MDLEGIDLYVKDHLFRCSPHIHNLSVKQITKLVNIDIENSLYVKFVEPLENLLGSCCEVRKIKFELDVMTCWNSTFDMVSSCLKPKQDSLMF